MDLTPSGAARTTFYASKWNTTLARSLALVIEQDGAWLACVYFTAMLVAYLNQEE